MTLNISQPVLIDVDGPVAQLEPAWLNRLNARDGTIYTLDDITHWCWFGDHDASDLLDGTIYDEVYPVPGAAEAVAKIRAAGGDVVYLTSCAEDTASAKFAWLRQFGFLLSDATHPDDVIIARRKSLVHGGVLIDDGVHNLSGHPAGRKFLWNAPWNQVAIPNSWTRVGGWRNVLAELGL